MTIIGSSLLQFSRLSQILMNLSSSMRYSIMCFLNVSTILSYLRPFFYRLVFNVRDVLGLEVSTKPAKKSCRRLRSKTLLMREYKRKLK